MAKKDVLVSLKLNTTQAVRAINNYSKKIEELKAKIEELNKMEVKHTDVVTDTAKQIKQSEQQIAAYEKAIRTITASLTENMKKLAEQAKAQKDSNKAKDDATKSQKTHNQAIVEAARKQAEEVKSINAARRANVDLRKAVKDLHIADEDYKKSLQTLNGLIDKNTSYLRRNTDAYTRLKMGIGEYNKGMTAALSAAKLTKAAYMGIFAFATQFAQGISTAIEAVFGKTIEFEKSFSNLAAITGTTKEKLAGLEQQALSLGRTTNYTASEVLQLQTELAKLGFNQTQIKDATQGVLEFAQACDVDLAQAAKLAGSTIRAFGADTGETKRYVSAMAISTTKSALSFQDLETAMGIIAPVAHQFNFSIEDTLALLAQLKNAGMDNTMGATALRNVLLHLANEHDKLAKTIGGPVHNLEEMAEAFKKLKEQGIDLATAFELTDKRALTGFTTLIETSDKVINLRNSLRGVEEDLDQMAKTMTDNSAGALKRLESAWEGLLLTMRNSDGVLKKIIDGFAGVINAINDGRGKIVALGKVVLSAVGTWVIWKGVILAWHGICKAGILLQTAWKGVTIAWTAVTRGATAAMAAFNAAGKANVIGAVVTAISAAVAAFGIFKDELFGATDAMSKFEQEAQKTKDNVNALAAVISNDSLKGTKVYKDAMSDLTTICDEYNVKLEDEEGKMRKVNEVRKELVELIDQESNARIYQDAINNANEAYNTERERILEEIQEWVNTGNQAIDTYVSNVLLNSMKEESKALEEYISLEQEAYRLKKELKDNTEVWAKAEEIRNKIMKDAIGILNNAEMSDKARSKAINELTLAFDIQASAVNDNIKTLQANYDAANRASKAMNKLATAEDVAKEKARLQKLTVTELNAEIQKLLSVDGKQIDLQLNINVEAGEIPDWISKLTDDDAIKQLTEAMVEMEQLQQQYNNAGFIMKGILGNKIKLKAQNIKQLQLRVEQNKKPNNVTPAKTDAELRKEENARKAAARSEAAEKRRKEREAAAAKRKAEQEAKRQRDLERKRRHNENEQERIQADEEQAYKMKFFKQRVEEEKKAARESAKTEEQLIQKLKNIDNKYYNEEQNDALTASARKYKSEIQKLTDMMEEDDMRDDKLLTEKARNEIAERIRILNKAMQYDYYAVMEEYEKKDRERQLKMISDRLATVLQGTQAEYDLKLQQLKLQEEMEIESTTHTEEEKELVRAKYRQQQLDLAREFQGKQEEQLKRSLEKEIMDISIAEARRLVNSDKAELERLKKTAEMSKMEYELYHSKGLKINESEEQFQARMGVTLEQYYYNLKQMELKHAQDVKAITDKKIAIRESEMDAFLQVGDAIVGLIEKIGEKDKGAAQIAKTAALAMVVANIGVAISKMTAAEAGKGIAGIGTTASGIANILAQLATAIGIINSYASGGLIKGKGTGTSDSNLAYVSNGESVITARATSMFAPLLSAINTSAGGAPIGASASGTQAMGEEMLARAFARGCAQIQPVVSVKDINQGQQRVKVIESNRRLKP